MSHDIFRLYDETLERRPAIATMLGYVIYYVADVGATLQFFNEAFDLPIRFVTEENDYGELATGETTLAFALIALAHSNLDGAGGFAESDPAHPPQAGVITLVTTDLPELFARAVRAGATRYVDPMDKPWGQTVAYVRDANGILIELATPVEQ